MASRRASGRRSARHRQEFSDSGLRNLLRVGAALFYWSPKQMSSNRARRAGDAELEISIQSNLRKTFTGKFECEVFYRN